MYLEIGEYHILHYNVPYHMVYCEVVRLNWVWSLVTKSQSFYGYWMQCIILEIHMVDHMKNLDIYVSSFCTYSPELKYSI